MNNLLYWHWFALALLLMIAETLGAAGLLVALGTSAAFTGFLTLIFSLTWPWQLCIFSILSVVSALTWWMLWKRKVLGGKQAFINQPLQSMLGQKTVLVEAIVNGRGKIRINDAYWVVTGHDLPENTTVKIISVTEDNLLFVEAL